MNIHFYVFGNHIGLINLLVIFCIPAITMRLISEEKKSGTFGLLLTSPITATDIALGKYLAGFMLALIYIFVGFLFPLGTLAFADFSLKLLLASMLGVVLMTGVYVALDLFASSMTQSQFLSIILCIVLNVSLWFFFQGGQSSSNEVLDAVLDHLQFAKHLGHFVYGSVSTSSIIFFLSVIFFFVFLTQRVVESARWR